MGNTIVWQLMQLERGTDKILKIEICFDKDEFEALLKEELKSRARYKSYSKEFGSVNIEDAMNWLNRYEGGLNTCLYREASFVIPEGKTSVRIVRNKDDYLVTSKQNVGLDSNLDNTDSGFFGNKLHKAIAKAIGGKVEQDIYGWRYIDERGEVCRLSSSKTEDSAWLGSDEDWTEYIDDANMLFKGVYPLGLDCYNDFAFWMLDKYAPSASDRCRLFLSFKDDHDTQ